MLQTPYCYIEDCKHYRGIVQPDGTERSERHFCSAYPNGIPDDIVEGKDKHLEVRNDQDNDIVYEEAE